MSGLTNQLSDVVALIWCQELEDLTLMYECVEISDNQTPTIPETVKSLKTHLSNRKALVFCKLSRVVMGFRDSQQALGEPGVWRMSSLPLGEPHGFRCLSAIQQLKVGQLLHEKLRGWKLHRFQRHINLQVECKRQIMRI